jgi:hypothetical protein
MDSDEKNLILSLADRVLRLTVVGERALDAQQRQSRAVEEIASREHTTLREMRLELKEMNRLLALVVDNVKDTQRSAEDAKTQAIATREVTGSFKAHSPDGHDSGSIERTIGAAGKVNPRTYLSIGGAVLLAGMGVGAGIAVFKWLSSVLGAH